MKLQKLPRMKIAGPLASNASKEKLGQKEIKQPAEVSFLSFHFASSWETSASREYLTVPAPENNRTASMWNTFSSLDIVTVVTMFLSTLGTRQFCPRGKGAMRLTLCEPPTCEPDKAWSQHRQLSTLCDKFGRIDWIVRRHSHAHCIGAICYPEYEFLKDGEKKCLCTKWKSLSIITLNKF